MRIVPRHVHELCKNGDFQRESPILPLLEFREKAAWVLLGEPGAGKSVAFEQEASATDGVFISIAKFLSDEPDTSWQGKTLFLDGLDETRAGGDVSVLLQLRAHLRKLGNPPFRLACRAADWFGSTDSQAISDASPDRQLAILLLEPLSPPEILGILSENHQIGDPASFVQKATELGIDGLLSNPQTLQLLAKAIRNEEWPSTRQETFQLACEKLADEDNKGHRIKLRVHPIPVSKLLDTAGQLCAVLLLSDRTGLALDTNSADQHFPLIDDLSPPDPAAARRAAGRKLFRLSPESVERVVPSHRSIAEYLAARWLGEQIDRHHGLPLRRVFNLLLGHDQRTVAGLRGLYGWLALHCQAARARLIEADPLTVILYGDVKPMSLADKRHLLEGLRQEARQNPTFQWGGPSVASFGALADPDLAQEFAAALQSPDRDEVSQTYAEYVLDVLYEGEPIPSLAVTLKTVVQDETRGQRIRRDALLAWLKQRPPPEEAMALLDAINNGRLADPGHQLAGHLLRHLYPDALAPEALLSYLRAPKEADHIGSYTRFWGIELSRLAPTSHIPVLLDLLASREDLPCSDKSTFRFYCQRMLGSLLTKGVEIHGEDIPDKRLFAWLGIGSDKHGNTRRDKEHSESIANWLKIHPERYKAILALCFAQCESAKHVGYCIHTHRHRLHGAVPPKDIGLWHLEQASQTTNDDLAQLHVAEAVSSLIYQHGNAGLSLEKIEEWGDAYPERKHWLSPLLRCELEDWRREDAAEKIALKLAHNESRRERSIALIKHLETIRSGTANAGQMHHLACVWMDHFIDIDGKTPLERFDSYCENGVELLTAAEAGFFLCPVRHDLPSVAEIIALSTKQQEHFIRQPCLIGMELRWQGGVSCIDVLGEDTLRRMFAFRLTYGIDETPEWFTYFVRKRPALLAEVLVDYVSTTLKAGQDSVSCISPLYHDPGYRNVALIAVPSLLRCFPVRARSGQLSSLASLLKAALRYSLQELPGIIERKLVAKGMDVAQKTYWLTTAMLLDPPKYEPALWQYIGKSWTRANHLLAFLGGRDADFSNDYPLSPQTIGKLIELLTPHAELEQRSGFINEAMQRGESIRAMITRLGAMATKEAAQEIERLLSLAALGKLKYPLENAHYQLRQRQRETAFRFLSIPKVARILANQEPTSTADLAALAVEHLEEIADELRHDNDDGVRAFWNVDNKKPTGKREENLCRDILLTRLRSHLTLFKIDCQPEGDYANDTRADIRVSYRNEFEVPIEIKRDDHRYLWTSLHSQLIKQYTNAPKAAGHGIYLVLWFGQNDLPPAKDGGKKPTSPEELRTRLEAQLDAEERKRIFVRILDVSWA